MMFKSGIQRTLTKQTFRGALIEVYLSKYSNLSTEFSTNNTTNKYLNNLKLIFFKLKHFIFIARNGVTRS